ncbi:MBL fold metallo-hydrolase [Roseomonas fluvialis]|uniref:MBL fold metallo-hydrolase n=1 Tax=Roseomonas fluvialis TaxID=1750527 RepID=A0ABM7Y3D5_9PROT|nr:MBL fold metallo-hydrolase [Roseomonas fluvialis]BDG72362.1 MBL fold metallo-hydrolase [Roseomonas fluvialis]
MDIAPPLPGQAREILPGLRWMRFPLPFPPHDVNVWLLEDGPGWFAIDAAIANDETRGHWRTALHGEAFGNRPLTSLLVTHFHPDHAGLMGWLSAEHGLTPMMTRIEWLQARSLWFDTGPEMIDHQAEFARIAGAPEEYCAFLRGRGALYVRAVSPLPRAFAAIADGDVLTIGGRDWRVLTGQGHAPDMACLFCAEARVLIAADQVLPRISPYIGLHAGEPMADPLGAFLATLEHFRALPEDTLVLPSHGLPFTPLHARLDALAAHHADRLAALEDACAAPATAHALLPALFRRPLDQRNLGFGLGEALAHLRRLEAAGRVERMPGADGVIAWGRK